MTETNTRTTRAGGIILLVCVVIGIILVVLANLGIIAAGFFMMLLVALVVVAIIGIGIAVFAIPVYVMKDTKVEAGTYEIDDIAVVNDTDNR